MSSEEAEKDMSYIERSRWKKEKEREREKRLAPRDKDASLISGTLPTHQDDI